MFNYSGQVCDACGLEFTKDSDIVVCPDCGTPHHRECWKNLGHCINQDKHVEGFEWKAPVVELAPNQKHCPACNSICDDETLFCENCGHSLKSSTTSAQKPLAPVDMLRMNKSQLNERIEQELSGEIDGVSVKDIAIYIGPGAQSYIFKFKRMNENKNYKPFCWSAFLFSPLYFLYRKMWKIAAISYLFNALVVMGLSALGPAASLLVIGVSVYLGFVAVPMYKKQVISDLKRIKSMCNDQETYYRTILAKSGPSKIALAIMAVAVLTSIFGMFL